MTFKQQAVSGVKWTGFSTFIISGFQLLQIAFLGRILSPSDFGLMAMVMVSIGFAQLFADMGISNAIIYRQDATHQELSSLYWLNIFCGFIIFLFIWFFSPTISNVYKEIRLSNLLRVTGVIFLIVPFGQQFQILLQKELNFNVLAKLDILSSFLSTFITIFSAYAGHGVYSLIWGQIGGALFGSIYLICAGWKKWRPSFIYSHKDVKKFISFGLYQMGERSINYLYRNLDKILIGRLLGSTPLGFYSVAYQLMIRPMKILNPVITKVAFPLFSKIQNSNQKLRNGYLQVIEIISFVSMPIFFGMFAVSDSLVPLLLGHAWINAVPIFNVLVILGVFYSLGNPIGSLLLAKGRADLGFWFNVFVITVSVPTMVFASRWGVMGIAWMLVSITAFIFFPSGFFLRWVLLKLRPLEYIRAFIGFFFIAFAMAFSVKLLGRYMPINAPLLRLCILTFIGVFFYVTFIWLLKKSFLYKTIKMIKN